MEIIALQAIPKQVFNIVLDNVLYEIGIIETNGCMSMNLTRGGVDILDGQRVVAGKLCIPYPPLEADSGNFMFLTQNNDLPYYDQFGLTQSFLYASNAELEAVRDGGN